MLPAEVKLFWQPEGKFLAVQVDRFTKTRKTTYTSFELFTILQRDIPMEVGPPSRHCSCVCSTVWLRLLQMLAVSVGAGRSMVLQHQPDLRSPKRK